MASNAQDGQTTADLTGTSMEKNSQSMIAAAGKAEHKAHSEGPSGGKEEVDDGAASALSAATASLALASGTGPTPVAPQGIPDDVKKWLDKGYFVTIKSCNFCKRTGTEGPPFRAVLPTSRTTREVVQSLAQDENTKMRHHLESCFPRFAAEQLELARHLPNKEDRDRFLENIWSLTLALEKVWGITKEDWLKWEDAFDLPAIFSEANNKGRVIEAEPEDAASSWEGPSERASAGSPANAKLPEVGEAGKR